MQLKDVYLQKYWRLKKANLRNVIVVQQVTRDKKLPN